ncbi:MAG: ferredoxin [Phycisphaerales bacterium]|jgi:ferredoxin|nr:ferredoxin [Phycisphaerales bacterium]
MSEAKTQGRLALACVDLDKCVGSTLCVQIAADVFRLAGNGQSEAVCAGSCESVVNAAEACPNMAITVTDSQTGETLFP